MGPIGLVPPRLNYCPALSAIFQFAVFSLLRHRYSCIASLLTFYLLAPFLIVSLSPCLPVSSSDRLLFAMPTAPATAPTPILEVTGLTYRRRRPILKGINWRVEPGQHWAILGPNGCGKTSLINLITGYDFATGGTLKLGDSTFGEDDWREVRRRVGLVTNTLTTYLESGEPVLDVIASGREAKLNLIEPVTPAVRREAAALLKQVGCTYLKDALWGPLSQGEKQKVLICRALMAKFQVLILDEPCAGLDPVAREHFLTWMQTLSATPGAPSLVMVTHHVEEILPAITHCLLLKDGQVHASGEKHPTLTSANLSQIYGAEVKLSRHGERYSLRILS